jgi:hypothetical protein
MAIARCLKEDSTVAFSLYFPFIFFLMHCSLTSASANPFQGKGRTLTEHGKIKWHDVLTKFKTSAGSR